VRHPAEADDVGERRVELPRERRAHEHVARRQITTAQQRVAADRVHERAQPFVGLPDADRHLQRLAQLLGPRRQLQRNRGKQPRQREGWQRRPQLARPRESEQARQSDAAEHAHDGRGRRHEARQAGEIAGGGHQRDDGDPRQRTGQQPPCTSLCGAGRGSEHCERPGGEQRQRQRALRHLGDGVQRAVVAALSALGTTERVAGRQQLGTEPQRRNREPERDRQRPRRRLAPPAPQPVGRQQRPDLRAQQGRECSERERGPHAPVDARVHRAQHERDEQRLGHALGALTQPRGDGVQRQQQRERGKRRGGDPLATRVADRQHVRQPPDEHEREQPRRTHEHEPQLRRRVPGQGQDRRDPDGERLPRWPRGEIESRAGELAAPYEPCPGVVDRVRRQRQRRGSERKAGADHRGGQAGSHSHLPLG